MTKLLAGLRDFSQLTIIAVVRLTVVKVSSIIFACPAGSTAKTVVHVRPYNGMEIYRPQEMG